MFGRNLGSGSTAGDTAWGEPQRPVRQTGDAPAPAATQLGATRRAAARTGAFTPAQACYLDALRGVSALLVLVGHAGIAFLPDGPLGRGNLETFGVVAFFLLSGFLITASVLARRDEPGYGFAAYVCDRFFRIFTPYLPALILVAAVDLYLVARFAHPFADDVNVATWIANLFMLQDYPLFQVLRILGVPDQPWFFVPFGSARPFWTIAIEWWIYLAFGFAAFVALARRARPTPRLLLAGAVLAVVPGYHFVGGFAECLTLLWLLGMAAAQLWRSLPGWLARHPRVAGRMASIGLAVGLFGALCLVARLVKKGGFEYDLQTGLFLAIALFGLFLALGQARRAPPGWLAAPFAGLAAFSYSLYLTHFTVVIFVAAAYRGTMEATTLFWTTIGASLALAVVFWALFERHHRALARRAHAWLLRRAQAAGGAPAAAAVADPQKSAA